MNKISLGGGHSNVVVGGDMVNSNIVTGSREVVFDNIRHALENLAGAEREKLLVALDELRQAKGRTEVESKFANFMSLAANSMTVLQPFLPELARLLT